MELKYAAGEARDSMGPAMVSRAHQQVAPNTCRIQSNPSRQLTNLRERDAAVLLCHPTASVCHRECHEYVDIAHNGVMQAMP